MEAAHGPRMPLLALWARILELPGLMGGEWRQAQAEFIRRTHMARNDEAGFSATDAQNNFGEVRIASPPPKTRTTSIPMR